MSSYLTSWGLTGIDVVPYGIHMCHFYETPRDLVDALVPYFLTGLAHNERCIWLGAPPLPIDVIRTKISNRPTLERAVNSGQLLVLDAAEWYAELNPDALVERWVDEEKRAIADGYRALRISGNTGFLTRDGWNAFMDYERKFHARIRNCRIVACCSYHSRLCEPVDVLEVVRSHDAALDRSDDVWEVALNASRAQSAARHARDNQRDIVCGPSGPDRDALGAEYRQAHKLAGVPPGSSVRPRG